MQEGGTASRANGQALKTNIESPHTSNPNEGTTPPRRSSSRIPSFGSRNSSTPIRARASSFNSSPAAVISKDYEMLNSNNNNTNNPNTNTNSTTNFKQTQNNSGSRTNSPKPRNELSPGKNKLKRISISSLSALSKKLISNDSSANNSNNSTQNSSPQPLKKKLSIVIPEMAANINQSPVVTSGLTSQKNNSTVPNNNNDLNLQDSSSNNSYIALTAEKKLMEVEFSHLKVYTSALTEKLLGCQLCFELTYEFNTTRSSFVSPSEDSVRILLKPKYENKGLIVTIQLRDESDQVFAESSLLCLQTEDSERSVELVKAGVKLAEVALRHRTLAEWTDNTTWRGSVQASNITVINNGFIPKTETNHNTNPSNNNYFSTNSIKNSNIISLSSNNESHSPVIEVKEKRPPNEPTAAQRQEILLSFTVATKSPASNICLAEGRVKNLVHGREEEIYAMVLTDALMLSRFEAGSWRLYLSLTQNSFVLMDSMDQRTLLFWFVNKANSAAKPLYGSTVGVSNLVFQVWRLDGPVKRLWVSVFNSQQLLWWRRFDFLPKTVNSSYTLCSRDIHVEDGAIVPKLNLLVSAPAEAPNNSQVNAEIQNVKDDNEKLQQRISELIKENEVLKQQVKEPQRGLLTKKESMQDNKKVLLLMGEISQLNSAVKALQEEKILIKLKELIATYYRSRDMQFQRKTKECEVLQGEFDELQRKFNAKDERIKELLLEKDGTVTALPTSRDDDESKSRNAENPDDRRDERKDRKIKKEKKHSDKKERKEKKEKKERRHLNKMSNDTAKNNDEIQLDTTTNYTSKRDSINTTVMSNTTNSNSVNHSNKTKSESKKAMETPKTPETNSTDNEKRKNRTPLVNKMVHSESARASRQDKVEGSNGLFTRLTNHLFSREKVENTSKIQRTSSITNSPNINTASNEISKNQSVNTSNNSNKISQISQENNQNNSNQKSLSNNVTPSKTLTSNQDQSNNSTPSINDFDIARGDGSKKKREIKRNNSNDVQKSPFMIVAREPEALSNSTRPRSLSQGNQVHSANVITAYHRQ